MAKRKKFQMTMNEGDAVIRLRSNKVIELVFAEDDENIYDPKGKARHARPFKPAILIE